MHIAAEEKKNMEHQQAAKEMEVSSPGSFPSHHSDIPFRPCTSPRNKRRTQSTRQPLTLWVSEIGIVLLQLPTYWLWLAEKMHQEKAKQEEMAHQASLAAAAPSVAPPAAAITVVAGASGTAAAPHVIATPPAFASASAPVYANTTLVAIHTPAPVVSESFILIEGAAKTTMAHATAAAESAAVEVKPTPAPTPSPAGEVAVESSSMATPPAAASSAVFEFSSIAPEVAEPTPTPAGTPAASAAAPEEAKATATPAAAPVVEKPAPAGEAKPEETPKEGGAGPVPAVENNGPPSDTVQYPAGFLVGKRRVRRGGL
jgi:hypothetical protein